jgi:hypothetical protein
MFRLLASNTKHHSAPAPPRVQDGRFGFRLPREPAENQ